MAMAAVQAGSAASTSGALGFSVRNGADFSVSQRCATRNPRLGLHSKASSFLGRTSSFTSQQLRKSYKKASHVARAEMGNNSVVVPLQPESPIGQFLVSLLQSHPHLFSAAADQQIQQLAADKEADGQKKTSTTGSELILYKRIAEVREQDRQKAIVEVIYSLVVQKFLSAGLSMCPKITDVPNEQIDETKMQSMHSPEVLEVVKDHLNMILGRPTASVYEPHTIVTASKFRVANLYAATIVFGYFLRRLDQRYQLDMSMRKMLKSGETEEQTPTISDDMDFKTDAEGEKLAAEANAAMAAMMSAKSAQAGGTMGLGIFPQLAWKPSKLKSYVMSLDQDTLQRLARLRCRASFEVVDKQTTALFGKPEVQVGEDGSIQLLSDDAFTISLIGLRRLVLEAAAFGSFLWDAESYVDSHYDLSS